MGVYYGIIVSTVQDLSLQVGNCIVNQNPVVKSIGAHLDNQFTMDKQISSMCRSAWYYLHEISKIRQYITTDQTKSLVHVYVTSRIDQNNSLLLGVQKYKLSKLQLVQNASARLILGLRKRDHITPALKQLHWLSVESRILYKVLLLTYKALCGEGPQYLVELLSIYTPRRLVRSSADPTLVVPSWNYVQARNRAFGVRASLEWNALPLHIRKKDSVQSFKTALKTFLYRSLYE